MDGETIEIIKVVSQVILAGLALVATPQILSVSKHVLKQSQDVVQKQRAEANQKTIVNVSDTNSWNHIITLNTTVANLSRRLDAVEKQLGEQKKEAD